MPLYSLNGRKPTLPGALGRRLTPRRRWRPSSPAKIAASAGAPNRDFAKPSSPIGAWSQPSATMLRPPVAHLRRRRRIQQRRPRRATPQRVARRARYRRLDGPSLDELGRPRLLSAASSSASPSNAPNSESPSPPQSVALCDEFEAMRLAMPDFSRLERYERRAASRRKRPFVNSWRSSQEGTIR